MGSTYLTLHYHIVFSTKERRPFIKDRWRAKMHEYLGGTVLGLGGVPECVGGIADHVHLLVSLKATHCLADFVRELKKASSVWAADSHDRFFEWQDGYSAFTASHTHRDQLKAYISGQEEHHRTLSFVEELKQVLEKKTELNAIQNTWCRLGPFRTSHRWPVRLGPLRTSPSTPFRPNRKSKIKNDFSSLALLSPSVYTRPCP